MGYVRPKKSLGQHFLKDENIAIQIVHAVSQPSGNILEIGPGTGVLTKYLIKNKELNLKVIELDTESVEYLEHNYLELNDRIIQGDFLRLDLNSLFNSTFTLIGNFPYNISSQIMFKVLENKNLIPEIVGMFQNEVALRLAAKPGNRDYGILSVLLQAYYDIDYLFKVPPHVFDPPPKVNSAVIRVKRNQVEQLPCNEELFKKIIKTAFNQRRKMLRNALSALGDISFVDEKYLTKRAEELSVEDYIYLTLLFQKQ